jgi:hypothetical protein
MEFRKAIKVKTGKLYDARRRRIIGFYAALGEVEERSTGADASVQNAIDKLQTRLETLPNITGRLPIHRTIANHVLVIIPEDMSTRTMIVCPDGHVIEGTTPETNFSRVESSAREHIAQLVWPNKALSLSIVAGWENAEKEIRSWIQWQEAYAIAKEQGFDDTDCRYLAGNCPQLVKDKNRLENWQLVTHGRTGSDVNPTHV